MKLLNHRDIPSDRLDSLQTAVDVVERAKVSFDEAAAELATACKNVPPENQAPADAKKRKAWDTKRAQRLEDVGVAETVFAHAVESLATANGALRAEVEAFRAVAEALYSKSDSEAARRATCNVLNSDKLCAQAEDAVVTARKPQEIPFLEGLLLRQALLANQRHYTVRYRMDSARWTYVQDRSGTAKAVGERPSVPCLTFGEAERLCTDIGRRFSEKTSQIGFEVQVFNLVNSKSCGTAVTCSMPNFPRAED